MAATNSTEYIDKRHEQLSNVTWADDYLGRKPFGKALINILRDTPDVRVFALSTEFGAGKTFFLRCIENDLKEEASRVVYLDAWKTSYLMHPLLALTQALMQNRLIKDKGKLRKTVKKFLPILNLVPHVGSTIERITYNFLSDDSRNEFKVLGDHLTKASHEKRIILLIDELERCSPDYIVTFLETINHFFAVEGAKISILLTMNDSIMRAAFTRKYGSALDEYSIYIEKFIDRVFYFPAYNENALVDYLQAMSKRKVAQHINPNGFYGILIFITTCLGYKASIRCINQVLDDCNLFAIAYTEGSMNNLLLTAAMLLLFLRKVDDKLYRDLCTSKYAIQKRFADDEGKLKYDHVVSRLETSNLFLHDDPQIAGNRSAMALVLALVWHYIAYPGAKAEWSATAEYPDSLFGPLLQSVNDKLDPVDIPVAMQMTSYDYISKAQPLIEEIMPMEDAPTTNTE